MNTSNFSEYLFKPYFDLYQQEDVALNAYGPPLAYKRLINGLDTETDYLLVQRLMPTAFRYELGKFTNRTDGHFNPFQISKDKRSERWQILCEYIEKFPILNSLEKHSVSHILISLGYYEFTNILLKPYAQINVNPSIHEASLSYRYAFTRFMLFVKSKHYSPDDLIKIANNSPLGSMAKVSATLRLLVYYGRFKKDLNSTRFWKNESTKAINSLPLDTGSFTYNIIWSRYYRGTSFLPLLEKDLKNTIIEMKLSEEYAMAAKYNNNEEKILWKANIYPVVQSQQRLADIQNDINMSIERGHQMINLDPWYSNAHLDLGNSLFKAGNYNEALKEYQIASTLGPPTYLYATFLAGRCYEELGEMELATELYINALRKDPQGISTKQILANLNVKKASLFSKLYKENYSDYTNKEYQQIY